MSTVIPINSFLAKIGKKSVGLHEQRRRNVLIVMEAYLGGNLFTVMSIIHLLTMREWNMPASVLLDVLQDLEDDGLIQKTDNEKRESLSIMNNVTYRLTNRGLYYIRPHIV